MSFSFPELWLIRVKQLFTTLTNAAWLDGIPELDTVILETGSGTTSEKNSIHIPLEIFEAEVLVNNTSYPIAYQQFSDDEAIISLDKYQTKIAQLSDDQINGSSYEKIDSVVRGLIRGVLREKFQRAIHSLAPLKDTFDTPVIETTGSTVDGRKMLTYADLVSFKRKLDKMQMPKDGRRLVLSSDHFNDLLADRDRFATLLSDMNSGEVAPRIAGFEIYQYDANPYFFKDAGVYTKRPYGTVPTNGDHEASVCFLDENVAKKTGYTKQYFRDAATDPEHQTNSLGYRHYFAALPVRNKYMGAIVSGGTEAYTPEITSITPDTGSAGGETEITLNGVYFTGATKVTVSDKELTIAGSGFTIVSDTVIKFNIPSDAATGAKTVKVEGPGGESNEVDIAITV